MKKLILIILLFAAFSGEPISGEPVRPRHTYENYHEFVQDVKKTISIKRLYKIETEESFVLTPGQAVHLDFEDNSAGVVEFIFYYNDKEERVHVIFRCTDDAEGDYTGTSLHPEILKDYRGIAATGAAQHLNIFSECSFEEDKALVKFRTTMSLTEKDQDEIKEGDKIFWRWWAKEQQAKLEAVSELEWDYEGKIKSFEIIMDDPNDANLVILRNKYNLKELVSSAKDDYEKLRLITAWVLKQWGHNGDNKPSKSDPLTILKEASEGKRFRCVEYAKVVAGCARSLGFPSRVLALKRIDIETAGSGAGHVVAEVWLEQFNKWVFVDGQWGAIPETDGIPLNAVEFQNAIGRKVPDLKIRFAKQNDKLEYLGWVAPYLYYFDFNLDQRYYRGVTEEERITGSNGKIMLVPKGANKPKVFQIKHPIKNCVYISNPKVFYPNMNN